MNDIIITGVTHGAPAVKRGRRRLAWRLRRSTLNTRRKRPMGRSMTGIHFKYDLKTNKEG